MLGSWGLSQYPYIIPPQLTIDNAANEASVVSAFVICACLGMLILLPSLWYLFVIFKIPTGARPKETAASFALSLQQQQEEGSATTPANDHGAEPTDQARTKPPARP